MNYDMRVYLNDRDSEYILFSFDRVVHLFRAVCVVMDIPWHKSSSVYAAVLCWERTRSWLGLLGTWVPLAKDRAGQKQSSEEQ